MPGKHHLPRATAKEQRQYEHILSSEMKSGKSKKTAKRIAAATVRKGQRARNSEYVDAQTLEARAAQWWNALSFEGKKSAIAEAIGKSFTQYSFKTYYNKSYSRLHSNERQNAKTAYMRLVHWKKNPQRSKAKTALRKSGRALKGATRGVLSAGAQILAAGAQALNPSFAGMLKGDEGHRAKLFAEEVM